MFIFSNPNMAHYKILLFFPMIPIGVWGTMRMRPRRGCATRVVRLALIGDDSCFCMAGKALDITTVTIPSGRQGI
jgi:hypothetical protein